jgi:hypothetical protein
MSLTPPPQVPVAEASSNLPAGGELSLPTTATATATPTQDSPPQATTKPTVVAQTSDYGEPSEPSCLHVKRQRFSKRFTNLLASTHLRKRKSTAGDLPVHQPDEPPRISEPRGRSTTSKLPLGFRLPEIYDDGGGCWVEEYGYIYASRLDMSISQLNLNLDGSAETARCPSPGVDGPQHRVDSRIPNDSLGRGDGSKEQDPKDTGAPDYSFPGVRGNQDLRALDVRGILERARVSEVEATEAVPGNDDAPEDGNRCGSLRYGYDGDDDVCTDECHDPRSCCLP